MLIIDDGILGRVGCEVPLVVVVFVLSLCCGHYFNANQGFGDNNPANNRKKSSIAIIEMIFPVAGHVKEQQQAQIGNSHEEQVTRKLAFFCCTAQVLRCKVEFGNNDKIMFPFTLHHVIDRDDPIATYQMKVNVEYNAGQDAFPSLCAWMAVVPTLKLSLFHFYHNFFVFSP